MLLPKLTFLSEKYHNWILAILSTEFASNSDSGVRVKLDVVVALFNLTPLQLNVRF